MNKTKKIISVMLAVVLCAFLLSTTVFAAQNTLSIDEVKAYSGSMTYSMLELDAQTNVAAMDAVITYNTDQLEFVTGEKGDSGDYYVEVHENESEKGTIKVAMIALDGIETKINIAKLQFAVKNTMTGSASLNVSVTNSVDKDIKETTVGTKNGKITSIGTVKSDNTVVDNNGNKVGKIDEDGFLVNEAGSAIGIAANDENKAAAQDAASQSELNIMSDAAQQSGVVISSTESSKADQANTTGNDFFSQKVLGVQMWILIAVAAFVIIIVVILIIVANNSKKNGKENSNTKEQKTEKKPKDNESTLGMDNEDVSETNDVQNDAEKGE